MARYAAGRRTERRILAAVGDLLAERGLDGVTVKAICDRAGIGAGSFYNLFSSKEEAVLRVVADAIAEVDPHPEGSAPDRLDELVDAYIAFLRRRSRLARIYVQVAVHGGLSDVEVGRRFLRHHGRRVERFAAALRHEDPALDEEAALVEAEVLLGALDGLALRWALDPSFDFARHAHQAAARYAPRRRSASS